MSHRIEIVSEDLAGHLPACPSCGSQPVIYSRMWTAQGRLPRRQSLVMCQCQANDHDYWHDTLYLAVSVWTTYAKLAGNGEPVKAVDSGFDDEADEDYWNNLRHPDAF